LIRKICLVFPRFKYKSGDPPLGLCYIASYLRNRLDVEVSILDTTFHPSFSYVSAYLQAKKPELAGIYFDTLMYNNGKNIARIAKGMGAIVVGGGPHATVCPESIIDDVDIVVIGEGEKTMAELIEALPSDAQSQIKGIWHKNNYHIRKNPSREPISNLDSLEFPALDLVDMNKYFNYWHYLDSVTPRSRGINIIASRGCAFNCSFCQPTLKKIFGDRARYKSPEYLVKEIAHYIDKFKVNKFFFHDDTFGIDRKWAYRFFDILDKEKIKILWGCNSRISGMDEKLMHRMYEVGARSIHFGIESGSQRILNEVYQKGIRLDKVNKIIKTAKKIGIHTGGFFMLGAPTETEEEIGKTIKLAVSSGLSEASFSIVVPFPGTRLYDMVRDNEKYNLSDNYSDFDYYRKVPYSGGNFKAKRLVHFQRKALFLFYLHPRRWIYLLKHFLSLTGIVRLYIKMRRFF